MEAPDALEVEHEGLRARLLGHGLFAGDELEHGRRVDGLVGAGVAAAEELEHVLPALLDEVAGGLPDPALCAGERAGPGLELLVHVGALVLDAVDLDGRGDHAEAGVGCVDADAVDAIQHELEGAAEREGLLGGLLLGAVEGDLHCLPAGAGLCVALRGLHLLDEADDAGDEPAAAVPLELPGVDLLLDLLDVDDVLRRRRHLAA